VPDPGSLGKEAFDLRDGARAREAGGLVQQQGAGWRPVGYLPSPRSTVVFLRTPINSALASSGRMPSLV
jgi:hypothetical protein